MKKHLLIALCLLLAGPALADNYRPGYRLSGTKAKDVDTTTMNFNGSLSSADNTVQKALDTLDDAAGGSGAPTDATYITQTANGSLSAEQALSSLSTGVVTVTTGTGVLASVAPSTSGNVLTSNGTAWTSAAAAGGSPGGSTTQMQFNNAGAFGGATRMTYDNTSHLLYLGGNAGDFSIKWDHSGTGNDLYWYFVGGSLTMKDQNNNALISLQPASAGASNQTIMRIVENNGVQGNVTITAASTGKIPLNLKGYASQTASLFLVENSAGDDLFAIDAAGGVNLSSDLGGRLNIDGNVDQQQLWIQGHSTQTNNIVLVEKSDGTDLVTMNNTGDVKMALAGGGLYVKEGTNATMGVATLVAGTVTVSTTKVTANSRIFLTRQTTAGTLGTSVDVTARTAGTSFTITSNGSVLDTSDVAWMIVEPS